MSKNRARAAERLGMADVSLQRWIRRRKMRPILHEPERRAHRSGELHQLRSAP